MAGETENLASMHLQAKRKWLRLIAISFIRLVVLAVIIGGFAIAWHYHKESSKPIPKSVRQSVNYPIYYPTTIPKNYSLDRSSIKSSDDTVTYSFKSTVSANPITVTFQPIPKGFNPKSLFAHNPYPTTFTPIGTLYDLSSDKQTRVMITANNSLIFISSTGILNTSDVQAVITSLKPVQN